MIILQGTDNYGLALSGSSAHVAAALAGNFAAKTNYTGHVTLTDTHNLAELKTINEATTGTITLNNYAVALTGSADVKAALAGTFANTYTGNVTLTDSSTDSAVQATDISTIEGDTTGTITVSVAWIFMARPLKLLRRLDM